MAKYNEQKAVEKFIEDAKTQESNQYQAKEQRMVELQFNENDEVIERKDGAISTDFKQRPVVTSAIVVNLGDEAYTHGTSQITPNMFDTRDKTANAHNFIQNLERT